MDLVIFCYIVHRKTQNKKLKPFKKLTPHKKNENLKNKLMLISKEVGSTSISYFEFTCWNDLKTKNYFFLSRITLFQFRCVFFVLNFLFRIQFQLRILRFALSRMLTVSLLLFFITCAFCMTH